MFRVEDKITICIIQILIFYASPINKYIIEKKISFQQYYIGYLAMIHNIF